MSRSVLAPLVLLAALAGAAPRAHAIFSNGGFEQNSYAGWTLGGGINPGLGGTPPFDSTNVQIAGSGAGPASVVIAGSDPRAPGIVLPRVGTYTAKINDEATGARLTRLSQIDTVTTADVDPADGKPHIRFAFAPVMDDPGHTPQQQPYFYVGVRKVSDGSVLYEQFAYSGQPGVNFQQGSGSWKFLPFQNVDIPLPANAVGMQVELVVIAADCSLGGHGGYVYVDGFGSAPVGSAGGSGGAAVAEVQAVPALDLPGLVLLVGLTALLGSSVLRRHF